MTTGRLFGRIVAVALLAVVVAAQSTVAGDEPPKRSLVVRVSSTEGKPLAAVAIEAEGIGEPPSDRYAARGSPRWVRQALTDASGHATLDAGAGDFRVRARLAGYVTAIGDRVRDGEYAFALAPATRIEGRVVDAGTGLPRPRTRVICVPSMRCWWEFRDLGSFGESSTDAQGRFAIDTAPPGKLVVLRVDEPGFGRAHADVRTKAAGLAVSTDIALAPSAALRGIIRDDAGSPRRGTKVWAIAREPSLVRAEIADWPWRCLGISDVDAEATTGIDGAFSLDRLALNGDYVLFAVWAPEPAGEQAPARFALREGVRPGATAPLEVRLTLYPRAFVRLLDENRAPLKDASAVTYIDGHGQYNTRSDADGWAEVAPELDGLRRGKLRIKVIVRNRGQAQIDVDMSDGKDARVDVVIREQ